MNTGAHSHRRKVNVVIGQKARKISWTISRKREKCVCDARVITSELNDARKIDWVDGEKEIKLLDYREMGKLLM